MDKTAEIAAIRTYAKGWRGDNYLTSLFTESFLNWVETRILDDTAPDIMAALDFEHAEVLCLMDEVKQAERAVKNAEYARDTAILDRGEAEKMQASTQADLDTSYETVNGYRDVLAEIEDLAKEAWLRGETITPDSLRYILHKTEDIG